MKILVVADVLGIPNNGTTIATYNLVDALRKRGHNVAILCSDADKRGWANFFVADHLNLWPFNWYIERNGISLAKADNKLINRALEGVDLVHCMLPFNLANRTAKMANARGIPVTAGFHVQAENVTSHFFLMHSKLANRIVYQTFWKKLYRNVDCIHYPTQFIKGDFESVVGPTNGYVVSNGINKVWTREKTAEKPNGLKNKFVILSTGRYSREKRQDILLKAMKYSKYEHKIQIILAGEGPSEKKYRKLSKDLTNEPIFGLHSREELHDIISYSDLYVHPAYAELESIACLEAINCGLVPVINNSKRGAPRFFALDERNLYKKNSPKSLAEKIDYWIEHPKEKQKQSDEYLEFTKRFEFEHCMDCMEKMIQEAKIIRKYKTDHKIHHRVIFYKDALNEDFAGTRIDQVKLQDDYKYIHKNPFWKATSAFLYYCIAKPILWCVAKIGRGVRVVNKKALKKLPKEGYFIYGNHTCIFDAFIPQALITKKKRTYIVANPDAVSIKGVKNIVEMLGTLPTPSTYLNTVNFQNAIKQRIEEKSAVAIYPEAHIWPFYTGLRKFGDISFSYPAKLNAPVVAIVTTYRKSIFPRRPLMDITVSDPIYPDPSLDTKENQKMLHDQVYGFMEKTIKAAKENVSYIDYAQAPKDSAKYEK